MRLRLQSNNFVNRGQVNLLLNTQKFIFGFQLVTLNSKLLPCEVRDGLSYCCPWTTSLHQSKTFPVLGWWNSSFQINLLIFQSIPQTAAFRIQSKRPEAVQLDRRHCLAGRAARAVWHLCGASLKDPHISSDLSI